MTERKILFRGFHPTKRGKTTIKLNGKKIQGEWLYWNAIGLLADKNTKIVPLTNVQFLKGKFIEYETVGQWVTTDKNGNDVFDGDKVGFIIDGTSYIGELRYSQSELRYLFYYHGNKYAITDNMVVIGNEWESEVTE